MILEQYFNKYRNKTIGINYMYNTSFGQKKLIYADWAASGRLYKDIEDKIFEIGSLYGNTHSKDNYIGEYINRIYKNSKDIIRNHVNANDEYAVLTVGTGMTGALHKLHEIMDIWKNNSEKPVVFLTQMEHHSNYTTWLELNVNIEILEQDERGLPSVEHLICLIKKHNNVKVKIGSFTACSNVTGLKTNYYDLATIMHKYGGLCFIDFSASAPYVNIDLKYDSEEQRLDAIYFSPHKFLGGPGSSGVLIFNKGLYGRKTPTVPGGGTILWTNPWAGRRYIEEIEIREDAGTPGILQTLKVALAIQLKEEMGVEYIEQRDDNMMQFILNELLEEDSIEIFESALTNRIGIISFRIRGLHYKLVVKLLSDVYGIQVRGGCSCSGVYGHYLLGISKKESKKITDSLDCGNNYAKPGWVRLSINPIMSNQEICFIVQAIKDLIKNKKELIKNYSYCIKEDVFLNKNHERVYYLDNLFYNK